MNLKEQLKKAMENMANIKAAVESGEKSADDLTEAIKEVEAIQAKIKAADDAEKLMNSLGTKDVPDEKGTDEPKYRTLGEKAAAKAKEKGVSGRDIFQVTVEGRKSAAPMTIPSSIQPALTDVDTRIVEQPRRQLLIRDLFSEEVLSGNAITYFVESATVEGGPDFVNEGAKKPLTSFGDPAAVTKALKKIAAHLKESSELVEDAPWLASAIDGRLMYEHEKKVENYLVSALLGTSGIGTSDAFTADGILQAAMDVQYNSGYAADAIVINPKDYFGMRVAKDQNGQYYGGGFFTGIYGNGGIVEQPPIWGLRTVVTPAVAQGTCIVGAFKTGGSVARKDGATVQIANQNEDDFVKNLITILVEERLELVVRRPAAFVEITSSESDS